MHFDYLTFIAQTAASCPVLAMSLPMASLLVAIATGLIAIWSLYRNNQLRRALCELAEQTGQPTPKFRRRWLPQFGLKSMLVLTTLLAIVLGTFGSELMRARRQNEVVQKLFMSDVHSTNVATHYRLGLWGNGRLAVLFCYWFHSDFGCRVDQLQVLYEGYDDSDAYQHTSNADFEGIRSLTDLEALQVGGLSLSPEAIGAIASLRKLKRLSFINCRFPAGAMEELAQLPLLEHLEVSNCHLLDDDLQGIGQARRLARLALTDNELTDKALSQIGQLSPLRELNLQANEISGSGFSAFAKLNRLESLSLVDNQLERQNLATLAANSRLRKVYLYRSLADGFAFVLTREEIEAFWKDQPRVSIDWGNFPDAKEWDVSDNRPYYLPDLEDYGIVPSGGNPF